MSDVVHGAEGGEQGVWEYVTVCVGAGASPKPSIPEGGLLRCC